MKILIVGPQGSGKTTQAKILAKKFDLCYIGVGELLRQNAAASNEIGENARKSAAHGDLADDTIVANLFQKQLSSDQYKHGFVSDSYPRTHHQLDIFDPLYDQVFYLKVSEDEAVRRLLRRKREDDTPELIKKRLTIYHQVTEPLFNIYQDQKILVEIDGQQSIEEVSSFIEEYLEHKKG